ncbi:MAG: hypothetical protein ACJAY8_001190 [Sphingobacteriales bacterium]|jgi:hypothetical protein
MVGIEIAHFIPVNLQYKNYHGVDLGFDSK